MQAPMSQLRGIKPCQCTIPRSFSWHAAHKGLSSASIRPVRPAGGSPGQIVMRAQGTQEAPKTVNLGKHLANITLALAMSACLCVSSASARLEGVNKPELLPREFSTVIDVAGFLTPGEEVRIREQVEALESDTGIKLRVLAQNYPQTPGLAIKKYWGVDDDTVVFVADPNTGNILNFNVGANVDLRVPRSFWNRLAGKFGNTFYWKNSGQEAAILNAVSAIDTCLREPAGRLQCANVQGDIMVGR